MTCGYNETQAIDNGLKGLRRNSGGSKHGLDHNNALPPMYPPQQHISSKHAQKARKNHQLNITIQGSQML